MAPLKLRHPINTGLSLLQAHVTITAFSRSGVAMRYMAHLIGIPVFLLLAALHMFAATAQFLDTPRVHHLAIYTYYLGVAFGVTSIAVQIYNCWRIWQAYRGVCHTCDLCMMPTTKKNGRYGPYLKCWRCGHNHAIRN